MCDVLTMEKKSHHYSKLRAFRIYGHPLEQCHSDKGGRPGDEASLHAPPLLGGKNYNKKLRERKAWYILSHANLEKIMSVGGSHDYVAPH